MKGRTLPHTRANGRAALSALKASDRRLARLIDAVEPIDPEAWRKGRPVDNAFSVLIYSIIGQQISGYAADAIAGRFRGLFGGRMPTPAELLATDVAALKSVGLSSAKTTYIRSLAEHVVSGALDIDHIDTLPDDEVRRQITAVKGLGPWTADMFLLIHLRRPDVLSGGDLGIRQAVQRLYKLDHLPSVKEVEEIGQKWRPHRSLAGFYLWASNRTVPAARAAAKSPAR
jgi:DNA-3-methyladenine glycosylase II